MHDLSRRGWLGHGAAGLLALAGSTQVRASLDQASEPPRGAAQIALWLPNARLRGRGTMRFFGLTIGEVRLWTGAEFAAWFYAGFALALELEYARQLDGAAIARRSIAEMLRAGPLDEGQIQTWQDAMTRAFPDVQAGDRITGVYVPGLPTRFFHNGRQSAAIADPEFGRRFFGIWLATTTSDPGLRSQLIGAPA